MDVGINYRDLCVSGRLAALARALNTSETDALGQLTIAYYETQDREMASVTEDEFDVAVGVRITDHKALLQAMVTARLATDNKDGSYLIRGNEKHIAVLRTYRENAARGGRAKAAKRQALAKQAASGRLADGSQAAEAFQDEPNSFSGRQALAKQAASGRQPESGLTLAPAYPGTGTGTGSKKIQGEGEEAPPRPTSLVQDGTLAAAMSLNVTMEQAMGRWATYREAIRARSVDLPFVAPPLLLDRLKRLVGKCGCDTALADRVLQAFVASDHDWWAQRKWPLDLLDDDKDFTRAFQLAHSGPGAGKRVDPFAKYRDAKS